MLSKCVFLDRDGVINEERGEYTFLPDDFNVIEGVPEAIGLLKKGGYKVIVVTNQAGISQGLYTKEDMEACHAKMQKISLGMIDDIFFCRWHPHISESLMRKPDSVMLERAIALHKVDVSQSWLMGDRERDILSGKKVGLKTILIANPLEDTTADYVSDSLYEAVKNYLMSK